MVTEGGLYILTLFDDFGGTYGKSPLEVTSYFIFSAFGIINYRDVGNHLGLWIGQFLS